MRDQEPFSKILDRMDAQFDHMEARFDAKFNAMEARLDARLNAVETRFTWVVRLQVSMMFGIAGLLGLYIRSVI